MKIFTMVFPEVLQCTPVAGLHVNVIARARASASARSRVIIRPDCAHGCMNCLEFITETVMIRHRDSCDLPATAVLLGLGDIVY